MFPVSVVVATADRELLLQRSLDSVFNQSVKPLEVLVVDNGCHPLNYLSSSNLKVIRTIPRIGPGRARNVGAMAAVGQYLAFLDDDDVWEPDYLEQVADCIRKTNADAVLGQLMRLTPDGVAKPYKLFPENVADQRRVFYSNPGFGGQNLTIRRDVFLEFGGFDVGMPASEDRDLAARLLLAGKRLVSAPKAMAVLCDHQGERARHSLDKGNWLFIRKHWRHMTLRELGLAMQSLLIRYFKLLRVQTAKVLGSK